MTKVTETDKLAKILATMMEREADREQERRDREAREQNKREEEYERRETERARREDKRDKETREMILALREAQPAVPQTVYIDNTKLPKMTDGEDIETFLELFEAAMEDNNIPQAKWKGKVHAALDSETKLKIRDIIRDPASTYDNLKDALIGWGALTFSHTSENLMTGKRGKTLDLTLRQATYKWQRLLEKLSSEAADIPQVRTSIDVAIARFNTSPELKTYLDMKGDFNKGIFCRNADEWLATQPSGTKWSKRQTTTTSPYDRPQSSRPYRPTSACFHCGRMGHYSRDCRTKAAENRSI